MNAFIEKLNTEYNNLFSEGIPVYIAAGTNPTKPVNGEACKALLKINNEPMVLPIIKGWNELPETSTIYINGPAERFKEELEPYFAKNGITDYKFVNEVAQGDAKVLFSNIEDTVKRYELSGATLLSTCDMVPFDTVKARTILDDILTGVVDDLMNKGSVADLYFTIGNQMSEKGTFSSIKDLDDARPAMVLGPYDLFRLGGVDLFFPENLLPKKDEFVKGYSVRKANENLLHTLSYVWERLGYDVPESRFKVLKLNEGRQTLLKLMANYLKKYGVKGVRLPSPHPFYHLPLPDMEKVLEGTLGFKTRLIVTEGTEDVDNDLEAEAIGAVTGKDFILSDE